MRRWFFIMAAMAAGCASGPSALAPPEPEPGEPEVTRERTLDAAPLEDARAALDDGDRGVAAAIADSLWSAWLGIEELDPGSAEDLTELLDSVGAEDRAAQVLVRAPLPVTAAVGPPAPVWAPRNPF